MEEKYRTKCALRRLRSFLDKDKDYFIRLWQGVRNYWKQSLVQLIGLFCLFAVILLYLYFGLIDTKVFISLWIGLWVVILIAWWRINRKVKAERVVQHDFNPVSLGTLYFSFALSLWTSAQVSDRVIAIAVSLISLCFFVGVYARSIRTFLNTRAAPIVIPLTFFAFLLGFMLGWIPTFPLLSGIPLEIIMYFGFIWIVTILLRMVRELKNELVQFLFVVFFIFLGVMRLFDHNIVDTIGGVALIIIAMLIYLVATERLHPYGEVFEQ